MEILSLEELSKIRKNNKATSEEWEIIKRYLNTGACYSKEDAITIINNIKNICHIITIHTIIINII